MHITLINCVKFPRSTFLTIASPDYQPQSNAKYTYISVPDNNNPAPKDNIQKNIQSKFLRTCLRLSFGAA